MPIRWKVELLGGLRVTRADAPAALPLTHFRTQKTAALLGYLAYHPGREHPRELLTELLWPESDLDSARHRLNVALSALRAQLEPNGIADGEVLQTGRLTVLLRAGTITTDVAEFHAALDAADANGGGPGRLAGLIRAVESYRGRLLPACYEDWVLPEQQRLNERYLRAVGDLVQLLTEAGRLHDAMQYALAATAIDPLREEVHREVIRLYLALGHPDAARRQFHALEKLLADALGARPSGGTAALLQPDALSTPVFQAPTVRVTAAAAAAAPAQEAVEAVGGAVPLDSRFYVRRPADAQFQAAVERQDSIVLVKGAAQTGKTSLLARGLRDARVAGARVIRTDFQVLNTDRLTSVGTLLSTLKETIAEQLGLEPAHRDEFSVLGGPNLAFVRFLRREVLPAAEAPVVWGLDGVDRLFSCPFGSEVFELLRSLHNERAFDPDGPWQSLTLAIAYATEVHLFITDLNRSPFNVGTRIELQDLTLEQVRDLNHRYSQLLDEAELEPFHRLLGGHPYLTRRGLHELTLTGGSFAALQAQAHREEWIFGDHLRRLRTLLVRDGDLAAAVREVLGGQRCPTREAFYRLRSAGVLIGHSDGDARLRCELYATYLRQHLAET